MLSKQYGNMLTQAQGVAWVNTMYKSGLGPRLTCYAGGLCTSPRQVRTSGVFPSDAAVLGKLCLTVANLAGLTSRAKHLEYPVSAAHMMEMIQTP